jgi:putative protease
MELLAPAGSPEALDAAIGEGADSVYLGLKSFNARMRSVNFTYSRFEAALRSLRRMGKRLYVTVNTVFEQREADRVYQLLKYLSNVGPDALIVQDFGILAMIRSEFPHLKIHASTQMNVASGRGANALSGQGVSRVVLARELSLEELRSVRSETNLELEVFVHGALCVSASGLCLFSSYLGGKSANRGMCTQACRRLYQQNEEKSGTPTQGGYYFSPADLQLMESLPDLAAVGINALKIEGRMKSADYVGTVVSAYRLVLDAIATNGGEKIRQSIVEGQEILRSDFARSKTRFYFQGGNDVSWLNPAQDGGTGISLGVIQKTQGKGDERRGLVSGGSTGITPAMGDSIRLHRGDDSGRVSHKVTFVETSAGTSRGTSRGAFWVSIPEGFGKGDRVYLIQTKTMSKRYKPISGGSAAGARSPGFDKAPLPRIAVKHKEPVFPEGLYVAVSQINDLYIVQSSRPVRVMLSLTRKTARQLLGEGSVRAQAPGTKAPLPFKAADIILTLDPYFPQDDEGDLERIIGPLVELGYRQFMVNNLGHFSLFRNVRAEVQLIAGPWLYMFNSWALSLIASLGADGFVPPIENNRQNLERTLTVPRMRSMVFIPVFAWPSLFRIRADLGHYYDFTSFSDNRGETFSLVCDDKKTLVIPQKPFSIIDKIPFLREAGFRRFIIDLSGHRLKKTDYKDLMRAVNSGTPLPRISRFNWKDGFYSGEDNSPIDPRKDAKTQSKKGKEKKGGRGTNEARPTNIS